MVGLAAYIKFGGGIFKHCMEKVPTIYFLQPVILHEHAALIYVILFIVYQFGLFVLSTILYFVISFNKKTIETYTLHTKNKKKANRPSALLFFV